MAAVVWIFVQNHEGGLAPIKDQVFAVIILGEALTEDATLLFSAQDELLSPRCPEVSHIWL